MAVVDTKHPVQIIIIIIIDNNAEASRVNPITV